MKLYTKHGDDGSTGLIGGARVRKDDARVAAYGDVDETNAAIGLAVAACADQTTAERLRRIQSDLFTLGAELATRDEDKPKLVIDDAAIVRLEGWIDEASSEVEPLRNFVLPGGSELAARFHLARTTCRRAERAVVALAAARAVRKEAIQYLNRLSDLLFALARSANSRAGCHDLPWIAPAE